MQNLAADFVESLRAGRARAEPLECVGDPDPPGAARAFESAMADPDLARAPTAWVPALLASPRPGFGATRLAQIARACRESGEPVDLSHTPALAAVVGASDFLGRLLESRPRWVATIAGPMPPPPELDVPDTDWETIRSVKYRGLLRVAARDLAGRPFAESLRELSDLADACLVAGSRCANRELGIAPPALFALGKLGGRELNFSSDVDLLFVYDSPHGADDREQSALAAKFIRHLKKQMEDRTAEGFVFRVDLGLRPQGGDGALANSVTASLDYYEAFGAEWERQMLIRLRAVTGPPAVIEEFTQGIAPFVYRRSIGPEAFRAVRAMKERIEFERREAGRDLEANLKEGPGGIRDVEFLVQAFQLFWGGRRPELRTGNTLDGLDALRDLSLLDAATTSSLSEAYLWLRRAEHAQQMVEEQQTQAFPREADAQLRLARRMGYDTASGRSARDELLEDWTTVRSEVRSHFENLVLGGDA